MKKILIIITLIFTILFTPLLTTNASNTPVLASEVSTEFDAEFRAAWVSYYTGDISYKSELDYKEQVQNILDGLEFYNMNAMIFHIRANHDAWYKSEINKTNSQLANVNFDEFDPLEYIITETHKRGIEFHAWLNPYRIGSAYTSAENVAEAFKEYPNNPASKAENVLIGDPLQILDPGIPEVRDFLVETCIEIAENYDIDAIHFDDYFYAAGIDDSKTVAKYNTNGLSVSDFRREQVDTFIYDLKTALDVFNQENNRYVQLGISPTGVYKNASSTTEATTPLSEYKYNDNGDLVYPTGATTRCQMHYESYLYCDTLKWVNNEWINYILPQTYWSTDHSYGPFEPLINWWNMAVKNKDVNLYAGMGMYMWLSESGEAKKRLDITDELEYVKGTSIYSYEEVEQAYKNTNVYARSQMAQVKSVHWKYKTIPSEIAGFEPVKIGSVSDFVVLNNTISFSKMDEAKFYIIYRDEGAINYANSQIVDVISGETDLISWTDSETGNFVYDVIPVSYTNTLGEPTISPVHYEEPTVELVVSLNSDLSNPFDVSRVINLEKNATPYLKINTTDVSNNLSSYNWSSSNTSVATIDETGNINVIGLGTTVIEGILKTDETKVCKVTFNIYEGDTINNKYTVTFIDNDGTVLKIEEVQYGHSATPPTGLTKEETNKYTFEFVGWDKYYYNITEDVTIKAIFEPTFQEFKVTFKNPDGEILTEIMVAYGHAATPPENPTMEATVEYSYSFKEWDKSFDYIVEDTEVLAVYYENANLYQINYVTNCDASYPSNYYFFDENVYEPTGISNGNKQLEGWYYDSEFTKKCEFPINLTENTTIYAKWLNKYNVKFFDDNANLINSYEVNEGSLIPVINPPKKTGYIFKGWMLNNELVDSDYQVLSDIELYPLYEEEVVINEYYVYFYDFNQELIDVQIVLEGASATLPTLEKIDGYTFKGWDKEVTNVSSDLHVYAVYEKIQEPVEEEKGCKNCNLSFILLSINCFAIIGYLILKKHR